MRLRVPRRLALAAGALAVGAAAAALFFPRLGEAPLSGDEAIHALVARESAEPGRESFLPPLYKGRPYVAKPPLKILAVAWIFDRFGPSELHARVLDPVFGVATVVLVFLFGSRLWGPWTGALAALLLATAQSYLFDHGVRSGVQDSAFVFLLTAALGLYFLHREWGRPVLLLVAAGGALGLAALVKGAAAALALPVLAGWELARARRPGGLRDGVKAFSVVAALALGSYLVWVAAAYSWSEGRSLSKLYRDTVTRVTESIDPSHVHGPGFYPRQLAADFGSWLLAAVPAVLVMVPGAGRQAGRRGLGDPAAESDRLDREGLAFAGLWALVLLAVLSLSVSKLPWYLYPAYPAISLVLARGTAEAVRRAGRAPVLAVVLVALVLLGLWRRVEAVRSRLEEEPRVVKAKLYAEAIAELPHARLIIDRRVKFRAWQMYYLAPLGERPWAVPADVRTPSPGVCRFLLWRVRWAPGHVEARHPVRALPLDRIGEGSQPWLLDLDRCLPSWL
jgi:4-amino-4-deoxy-L-arabinose transferase-like glycosyltransferase